MPKRDYRTLDAITIVLAMILVAGVLAGLVFVKIPESQLPIVAGLVSSVISTILAGYAGYRWGASVNKPSQGEPTPSNDPEAK